MKIIKEDKTYLLPERNQKVILVENDESTEFIKCLSEYFGKKKKNYCHVHSDDEQPILPNEFEFIHYSKFSNIDATLNFNNKTVLNQEITNFVIENEKAFQSVMRIREEVNQLLSDSGMFRLQKIFEHGLDNHVWMKMNDFNISSILEFLSIEDQKLNSNEKILIVYNLLLYVSRFKSCIVYLDVLISPEVLQWMDSYKDRSVIFIINNHLSKCLPGNIADAAILKLSGKNYMETYEFDVCEFFSISYVLTPFVQEYIEMQTERNKNLYSQFIDNETTFYLEFTSH